MGARQVKWAKKKRDELFALLGKVCRLCGSEENLEFDCILPSETKDHHRKMSWDQRMRFYLKQLSNKNLQVLCDVCHGKKTRGENHQEYLKLHDGLSENEPF